ncbi:hypothetical protein A2U01_0017890 [Trifolium medium]|uniref:Uncharacterized protein n=1 Tax=Trifolium medium TaxID=97028 RepID=A0A392NCJ4_9FABA|nr:hypothetical protein [Trifolium medium]
MSTSNMGFDDGNGLYRASQQFWGFGKLGFQLKMRMVSWNFGFGIGKENNTSWGLHIEVGICQAGLQGPMAGRPTGAYGLAYIGSGLKPI